MDSDKFFSEKSRIFIVHFRPGRYNTNRHRDGRYIAESRMFPYQKIHAKKPLFGKKAKVLNLYHFDIVSTARCPVEDLELRISVY